MTSILPKSWDPKAVGDEVLNHLTTVTAPQVKGAHGSDFVIHNDTAYVVYLANDDVEGHHPNWFSTYNALNQVSLSSGEVAPAVIFAASEKKYHNLTLPEGSCFSPRLIQKDDRTLRCFFSSQAPEIRPSQIWHIDFDLARQDFDWNIHRTELETDQGIFPMQPIHFHRHAAAKGFTREGLQSGLLLVDGFKRIDGRFYGVINNYPGGQVALGVLNDTADRLKILGDFFLPHEAKLTEAAINRLPDGTWMAICRQENHDRNYLFTTSRDGGRTWTPAQPRDFVPNGSASKPTFNRFGDFYYLGWQEATKIDGVRRSVFNLDVSRDGVRWERFHRFETNRSFQYPTFREHAGEIYVSVTLGKPGQGQTISIHFGKLQSFQ